MDSFKIWVFGIRNNDGISRVLQFLVLVIGQYSRQFHTACTKGCRPKTPHQLQT